MPAVTVVAVLIGALAGFSAGSEAAMAGAARGASFGISAGLTNRETNTCYSTMASCTLHRFVGHPKILIFKWENERLRPESTRNCEWHVDGAVTTYV